MKKLDFLAVEEDVVDNAAKYPFTTSSVRTAEGDSTKKTTLTHNITLPEGTESEALLYSPPTDPDEERKVSGTSYLWVDGFASTSKMVGKTSGTNGTNTGGELYLMYGTNDDLYGGTSTGKESSAEFENQFSRNSTMRILQGTNLYKLTRTNNTAALFNSSGILQAVENTTRPVAAYYNTTYRIIDRLGNTVVRNNDTEDVDYGTFTFNNRTSAGTGVTFPVSEHLSVQLTEYVENTVKTNTLEIKKVVSGTAPAGTTGYNFTLQLKDVFGTDVSVSDYSGIKATKTGNATQTGYIDSDGKFTLTAGQSLTIAGIPYGTKYKITETNPNDGATITYSTVTTDENGFATLTSDKTSTNAFTVTNTYPSETGVDVLKKNGSNTPLEGAELELWYKETSTPPTYYFNDPQVVPYKMNGIKVSKSPSEIGIPGLEEVRSSYTVYTETTSYSDPAVPSSEDKDWILPRSDSDYIYFRDYNVGQYAGDNDRQSFSNTTGKRSWRYTFFAGNSSGTHNQDQELGFNDNYWYAAEFYGKNKKTVKYAMWERFVDDFTYRPYGASEDTTVDTVVWKIQPPDGYTQVRFILLNGDNWIRSTEKINFKLGEIYHKTSWGGVYSNGNYYDVPTEVEKVWAPNASGTPDQRNTAMEQPRKYEPTNQKIIFHCNSLQVWHNIHIYTNDLKH